MQIRYSNLSYQTNVIIASKKIEKTTDKDDKIIFICINVKLASDSISFNITFTLVLPNLYPSSNLLNVALLHLVIKYLDVFL